MFYAILVVFVAASTSAEVSNVECGEKFPKKMLSPWMCCEVKTQPNASLTDVQEEAVQYCAMNMNNSMNDSDSPPQEYDCEAECIFIRAGLMGKDKSLDKETFTKVAHTILHEDFHEASNGAIDTCIGKKINHSRCPSGLDGMIRCFSVHFMLNCPTKYWSQDEDCKETKNYKEKCGAAAIMDALYNEYDSVDVD